MSELNCPQWVIVCVVSKKVHQC
uniref:Uncharacterized protein n=1 Tax=Anguilla anguilla TaxID=7936 RepID=A0A0E9PWR3_ANGAN